MIKECGELKPIFDLRFEISKTFFKGFEAQFDFPQGVTPSHFKALMFLRIEGSAPMSKISERANLEKGSFTPVANRLISIGYIEKIQDENDKRSFNLRLTDKGKKLTERIAKEHSEYVDNKLSKLSGTEKEMLFSSAKMIIALLDKI